MPSTTILYFLTMKTALAVLALVWSAFFISFSNAAAKAKVVREVKYMGCMKRSGPSTEFKLLVKNTGRLDIKTCVTKCWEHRQNFAGLQKGTLCYCSVSTKEMVKLAEDDCDKRCTSNCYQACGGDNALSVYCTGYKREPVFQLGKKAVMSANIGCFDGTRSKDLCPKLLPPLVTKRMTVPMCLHFCNSIHQAKFATMSGRDKCCCSNSVRRAIKTGQSWCDTPCYGDKSIACIGRRFGSSQWSTFQISRVPDFKIWPKSVFQEAIWLEPPFPEGKDFEIIKSNAAAAAADASLSGLLNKQLSRKSKDDDDEAIDDDGAKVLENVVGEDKREPSQGNLKNNVAIVDVPDAKESQEPSSEESNGTIIAAIVVGFVILTVAFAYYMFSKKRKLEEAGEEDEEDEEEDDKSKRRRERRKSRRATGPNKELNEDEENLM